MAGCAWKIGPDTIFSRSQAKLGNEPFMGLRPTQDHETGGTGFPACAWTPEGGCPTLSEQLETEKAE
jgi:hypothetical protein